MTSSTKDGVLTKAVSVSQRVSSDHSGPARCRQQHGLCRLVTGLSDSCSFLILSVCVRLCGYYCVDVLFDSIPSV